MVPSAIPLLLLYSAQLQGGIGKRTSVSQEEKQKNIQKEGEQWRQEKEEKEEEEDVKGWTKLEENEQMFETLGYLLHH